MRVRYVLTMDDLVVKGQVIKSAVIDWEDDSTREQIMQFSQKWINTRNFLTARMHGLEEVGESSLTIEPIVSEAAAGDY